MINKCECGSTEFTVFETTIHDGSIDPDNNKLLCHSGEAGGIYKIICKKCNKTWTYEKNEIDFEIEFV